MTRSELARVLGLELVVAPIWPRLLPGRAPREADGQKHDDDAGNCHELDKDVHRARLARLPLGALVAMAVGVMLPMVAQACAVVQQTPDVHWTNQGDPAPAVFPAPVTATNSVACANACFNGSGCPDGAAVEDETGMNTYAVPNDSSSGDADSGNAAPFTRSRIFVAHNVVGGFDDIEINNIGSGNYGAFKCYELSGLAASPNDRACSVQDTFAQAGDANCAIGTLSQAEQFVLAVMTNSDGTDNNQNITGPTGGPASWTNDQIFQDATAAVGYSIDRGFTTVATAFTAQYSHDNLADGDHSIAAATLECAAAGNNARKARRRMN